MLSQVRRLRAVRKVVRLLGVHRVMQVVGIVRWPATTVLSLALTRVPRDPQLVVMGSPLDRFADNAAYLFVYLSEHATTLRPVWISASPDVVERLRSQGYRAERRWSRRGVLTTIRAGAFVYSGYRSDINGWLAPGALALALWHGLPIKRVEASIAGLETSRRGPALWLSRVGREAPPDYLLSSGTFVTTCFSEWFGVPESHCWELGYPRSDHLVLAPARPPASLVWHDHVWARLDSAARVVGLFLTWRDERVDDAVDESIIQRLVEVCARHDAVLAYKAHYNVAPTAVPDACVLIPADADLHAYLGLCDVLITDYSSVALDFLLTRRPVVYFMPDLQHYTRKRGLAVDPSSLPGILTRDSESLLSSVEAVLRDPNSVTWTQADQQFVTMMWGRYDGHSAQTILDRLEQTLEPGSARDQRDEVGQLEADVSSSSRVK